MTRFKWAEVWSVTLGLAALLNIGFLSVANSLGTATKSLFPFQGKLGLLLPGQIAFPVLAFLFWISLAVLPREKTERYPPPQIHPLPTFVLPLLIAFLYGMFLRPGPSLIRAGLSPDLLWYLIAVPLGEELLFRGWFYDLLDRRYEGRMATVTNPFPIAGWFSTLAFALWHLQNQDVSSPGFLAFQLGYTFLAGLWLSLLRWRTGGISASIVGHVAINVVASLI